MNPSLQLAGLTQSQLNALQTEISHIIDRSRHCDEMFLVDSKSAARDIVKHISGMNTH